MRNRNLYRSPRAAWSALWPLAVVVALAASGTLMAGTVMAQEQPQAHELQFRGEPVVLGADAARVGERIEDLEVVTVGGTASRLSELAGPSGLLIAMRDPGCPLSRKYGPRLAEMERALGEAGIGLLYVNPMPYGSADEAREEREWYGFEAPYVVGNAVAVALGATTSTEVFLLDGARTLQYRGAIDDQYGLGYTKPEATRRFLADAVAAVDASRLPGVRATLAPGCYLSLDSSALADAGQVASAPTWHREVSRIVQARCQRCHHEGGIGPFPLVDYRDVARRRGMIEWVLSDRIMPPWYVDGGHGEWANDMSLSEAEMDTMIAWLGDGVPEGDPAEAPLPLDWPTGWTLGAPDASLSIPEPFTVPAEGVVEYQYQYIKTDFSEDRWIEGLEVLPGARQVVHHVLVFIESPEVRERLRAGDRSARREFQGGARSYFASYVPGQDGLRFPDGFGKWLPAGAWLKVQLHYTPNGREMVDETKIGFHFGDEPGHTEVRTSSAVNFRFAIPPGDRRHEVVAEYTFERAAGILSVAPHTHLRGIAFRYELVGEDGSTELLLDLPRYDFNWQLNYELREPLEVPAGTVLRATAWYDNSADNPANPDPTVEVTWGDQTFEEMMIGYVNWVPLDPSGSTNVARR